MLAEASLAVVRRLVDDLHVGCEIWWVHYTWLGSFGTCTARVVVDFKKALCAWGSRIGSCVWLCTNCVIL